MKVGSRVGAILSQDDKSIEFLGYGIYEGDFIPYDAVGDLAGILASSLIVNPRIKLDNGTAVYGCECWWGPEDQIKNKIEKAIQNGIKVIPVNVGDFRQEFMSSTN